jgi:hypothetical protein
VTLHGALYLVDSSVQIYLGDSATYIATATGWHTPTDRSVVYGLLIKYLAFGSLNMLVLWQAAAFLASAFALVVILKEYLLASGRVALGVSLVASALPTNVIWTRYVMTEAFTLFCLTCLVLFAFQYLRSRHWAWLLPMHVFGIAAISLRLVMIPPVLAFGVLLPVLATVRNWRMQHDQNTGRRRVLTTGVVHLVVSLACIAVLHGAFKSYIVWRHEAAGMNLPAAYTHERGFFLVAAVAPLLQPEDFPQDVDGKKLLESVGPDLRAVAPLLQPEDFPQDVDGKKLLESVGPDLRDPRKRNDQRWVSDGVVARINALVAPGSDRGAALTKADSIASHAWSAAAQRDVVGVFRLFAGTLLAFWDHAYFRSRLLEELGLDRVADYRRYRESIHETLGVPVSTPRSPLRRLLLACQWYLAALSLVFVLIPIALWMQRRDTWLYFALLCALLAYFNAICGFPALIPSARFMQPVSWVFCLVVGGFDWRVLRGLRWPRRTAAL